MWLMVIVIQTANTDWPGDHKMSDNLRNYLMLQSSTWNLILSALTSSLTPTYSLETKDVDTDYTPKITKLLHNKRKYVEFLKVTWRISKYYFCCVKGYTDVVEMFLKFWTIHIQTLNWMQEI